MKLLANKYYLILAGVLLYLLFCITLRDPLINRIFDTPSGEPVKNANAYANATLLRSICSYMLLVGLIGIALMSIVLLFVKEGRVVRKWILIIVPVLIAVLFFCIMAVGGFS